MVKIILKHHLFDQLNPLVQRQWEKFFGKTQVLSIKFSSPYQDFP